MMFKNIAFLALATATAVEAQTIMAGLHLRTNVDDYRFKDLVQKELEDIMSDEQCDTFELGRKFYFALGKNTNPDWLEEFPDGGKYLASIPTWGLGNGESKSACFTEYTAWAGKNNAFHKQWVNKAFSKSTIASGGVTGDFTVFPNDPFGAGECVGFEEIVKKVTSYVYNFIEITQLCERAIQEVIGGCVGHNDECETAINYWEGAAAIYIGSLEGEHGKEVTASGSRSYGKSNYALADKRCRNYKTCSGTRDRDDSKFLVAPTNTHILALFAAGVQAAYGGDYALMRDFHKKICAKMVVPWIQGILRYTWRLSSERSRSPSTPNSPLINPDNVDPDLPAVPVVDTDYSELDKEVGEAAAFAVGAVGKLWACSKKAADAVWPQVEVGGSFAGSAPVNYQLVKLAFECNYKCLHISCAEVGSLRDGDDVIRNGAKTCNDNQLGTSPTGYAKCAKAKGSYKTLCKAYTKKPGIKKRDKPEYFAAETP
jgi:hypothetical protein